MVKKALPGVRLTSHYSKILRDLQIGHDSYRLEFMISFQFVRGIDDVRGKRLGHQLEAVLICGFRRVFSLSENLSFSCKDQRNPLQRLKRFSNQCQ